MFVLDIRGNAQHGSVPEGVGVVEEITKILLRPLATTDRSTSSYISKR